MFGLGKDFKVGDRVRRTWWGCSDLLYFNRAAIVVLSKGLELQVQWEDTGGFGDYTDRGDLHRLFKLIERLGGST